MKKNVGKYGVIFLSLLLCLCIFSACGKKDDIAGVNMDQVVTTSPESTPADAATPMPTETADVAETKVAVATEAPQMQQLPIYTINDESLECEAGIALIPKDSEITAELIVNTVVENLAEHSLTVGIDSVTVDKARVIVSFQTDKAPMTTVGSGVEATILDCISGSLLDNLDSCKQVVFRAEGKSYESGHIALGFDEAYAWK